ncbi:hypothetical protein K432DRAFT_156292 [Lepidopterella palustris CBS 459.81]|uniref:Secreted protein n=1 Tax=Lepidopterella palustris CBS 459.81 TaxID=1314670 RepID=A0A8E2E2E5_9PEZI|nr:hypothetical protein K432DRAFT_156292 [Lepidopterella palustris CBS 459.81]
MSWAITFWSLRFWLRGSCSSIGVSTSPYAIREIPAKGYARRHLNSSLNLNHQTDFYQPRIRLLRRRLFRLLSPIPLQTQLVRMSSSASHTLSSGSASRLLKSINRPHLPSGRVC